jgi:hypothetical protein
MRFLSEYMTIFKSKKETPKDSDLMRWAEIEFRKDSAFAFYQMKRGIFDYQDMLR